MKVVPGLIKEDESIHHWYRETLEKLDRSLATEKHKRIVLSMEGPRGPIIQVKAERLMAATCHHLEVMMVTCHQLGFSGEVVETLSFGRGKHALCWAGKPAKVRTLRTKLGVSLRDDIDFAVSEGLDGMKVAQRRCGESPVRSCRECHRKT